MDLSIANVFNQYPAEFRDTLLALHQMIFDVAAGIPEVGPLQESLKWGQPAYAPARAGIGSPIRLDQFDETHAALFFHCQTSLVETFKTLFSNELKFAGNRAILIDPRKPLPKDVCACCIEMALTYHLRKKRGNALEKLKADKAE